MCGCLRSHTEGISLSLGGRAGGGREWAGTTDNYSKEVLRLGSTSPDQVNSLCSCYFESSNTISGIWRQISREITKTHCHFRALLQILNCKEKKKKKKEGGGSSVLHI